MDRVDPKYKYFKIQAKLLRKMEIDVFFHYFALRLLSTNNRYAPEIYA